MTGILNVAATAAEIGMVVGGLAILMLAIIAGIRKLTEL
jgi:hypothetical protein